MSGDVLNKLSEDWKDVTEVMVYGFGRVAQRNIGKIIDDFDVKYIIDNEVSRTEKNYKGIPIVSLEEIERQIGQYKIIVATSTLAYASIKSDLDRLGLGEYVDYCRWEEFMPEWYWKYRGQVCVSQLFSTVTSRCTFKCKYCSMLMPEYKNHYTYTAEDIAKDFELLFQQIDYLTSWYVMGGEPLLHRDLDKILEIIYDRYHEKIGYIQVITNGSLVPPPNLIRVFQKCQVNVRVSDYTHAVSYEKKYNEVLKCLQENAVDYTISCYKTWVDLGFPRENICISDCAKTLKEHMLNCAKGCHSMNDGNLYFCGLLHAVNKLGIYQLKDTDYIDLKAIKKNDVKEREKILRYFLGDVASEYISLCKFCRGQGTDNPCVVPAAEQAI